MPLHTTSQMIYPKEKIFIEWKSDNYTIHYIEHHRTKTKIFITIY